MSDVAILIAATLVMIGAFGVASAIRDCASALRSIGSQLAWWLEWLRDISGFKRFTRPALSVSTVSYQHRTTGHTTAEQQTNGERADSSTDPEVVFTVRSDAKK